LSGDARQSTKTTSELPPSRRVSAFAFALRETDRGNQRKEHLMSFYVFNAALQAATALLVMTAEWNATSKPCWLCELDATAVAIDQRIEAEPLIAKAWYDRDFDFEFAVESIGVVDTNVTASNPVKEKAWYDRDFDCGVPDTESN
jgi:hypothetical protein